MVSQGMPAFDMDSAVGLPMATLNVFLRASSVLSFPNLSVI